MIEGEHLLSQAVEEFACEVMASAMFSGLSWKDAVAAFGLASKLLATQAAHAAMGLGADVCVQSQTIELLFAGMKGQVVVGQVH